MGFSSIVGLNIVFMVVLTYLFMTVVNLYLVVAFKVSRILIHLFRCYLYEGQHCQPRIFN